MFNKFDTDKSGTIGPLELRVGLSDLDLDFSDAEFAKIMRVIDPDAGGQVNLEEMESIVSGISIADAKESVVIPAADSGSLL